MSRYYGEELPEFDAHKVLNVRSNIQRLLKHELWRGQQRGGIGSPVHSRHIGSRCSVVPSAPSTSATISSENSKPAHISTASSESTTKSKDVALFVRCSQGRSDTMLTYFQVPYLHWEIEQRLLRMSEVVREATRRKQSVIKTGRKGGKFVEVASNWQIRLEPKLAIQKGKERSWRPQSPLAQYLWHVAKAF